MPEIGRFISEDPWSGTITTPTTMNPYPYVLSNPMIYVDPDGEILMLKTMLVGAVTGAAISGGVQLYKEIKDVKKGNF